MTGTSEIPIATNSTFVYGLWQYLHMLQRVKKGRLSREDWLAQALEELSRHGQGGLTIGALSAALGVSRGSFYWHFKSRDDFVNAMLEYWHQAFTGQVPQRIEAQRGTPEDRLRALMELVCREGLARYDLPIRAWAIADAKVADFVRKTDDVRLNYFRDLFREMGFSGSELEIRARSCLSYLTFENMLFDRRSKKQRVDEVADTHAFFIRR